MRLRTRQMVTVVALVAASVSSLAVVHLLSVVQVRFEESIARADLLARTVFQRAQQIVPAAADPRHVLGDDSGIRAILESGIAYTRDVAYVAIVDTADVTIVHSSPGLDGTILRRNIDLSGLMDASTLTRLRRVYEESLLEVEQPLVLGDQPFGAIRVGLSPVLIRADLERSLQSAAMTVGIALVAAMLLSGILARWALHPIHLIRTGLTRLGAGEDDVQLDLPADRDLTGVAQSFQALGTQLAEGRRRLTEEPTPSVTDRLADAVAIVNADGRIVFANDAMRSVLAVDVSQRCRIDEVLPPTHPCRRLVSAALEEGKTQGPDTVRLPAPPEASRQCQITAHVVVDEGDAVDRVLLVVRDVDYARTVESTLRSSRQLQSVGRLLAGVAHEVKNPINAMLLHLELLQNKVNGQSSGTQEPVVPVGSILGVREEHRHMDTAPDGYRERRETDPEHADAATHVAILGNELRRLDGVIQGFLRFIRPRELKKGAVVLGELIDEVCALVHPEAHQRGVTLENRCSDRVPAVCGDREMLRQALLNLAINACQAMSSGGALRFSTGTSLTRSAVWVDVEDTGTGMSPEELKRIFDLYYTTKDGGTGIGLSMVYRIVLLHDGDIEVESTPGEGTRFRVTLPRTDAEEK